MVRGGRGCEWDSRVEEYHRPQEGWIRSVGRRAWRDRNGLSQSQSPSAGPAYPPLSFVASAHSYLLLSLPSLPPHWAPLLATRFVHARPFLSPRLSLSPSLRIDPSPSTMRRAGSTRASSPTNSTYSGISNYRTDSYKPLMRDPPSKEYSNPDPRAVARVHFEELSQYLAAYLAKGTS